MYEQMTYESLQQQAKAFGDAMGVRTTQGEIFYDATSFNNLISARLYADIEVALEQVLLTSATGGFLDERASEHGLTRREATASLYTAIFDGTIPAIGARFFANDLYFRLTQDAEHGFLFESEAKGGATSTVYPGTPAVPMEHIEGLMSATFGELIAAGSDQESDDSLRDRIQARVSGPAENGNRHHYKVWCEQVDDVGRARIWPLWAGPNTVMGILIGTNGLPAGSLVVEKVQEYVDPGGTGLGEGVANIGAYFTAIAAEPFTIDISFSATPAGEYTIEDVQQQATVAIMQMLKTQALETPDEEDIVVRLSSIGAILYALPSVLDYSDLQLNDQTSNIPIGMTEVAVLGEVTVSAIV